MLTGWFALVEYDRYSEEEKKKIVAWVKESFGMMFIIILMPLGLILYFFGVLFAATWLEILGATSIFSQSILVSLLFWKQNRWKSAILLIGMMVLGTFLFMPFFEQG